MNDDAPVTGREIDRYPDEGLRASWLLLAGHPALQELRVRNHELAEGSSTG